LDEGGEEGRRAKGWEERKYSLREEEKFQLPIVEGPNDQRRSVGKSRRDGSPHTGVQRIKRRLVPLRKGEKALPAKREGGKYKANRKKDGRDRAVGWGNQKWERVNNGKTVRLWGGKERIDVRLPQPSRRGSLPQKREKKRSEKERGYKRCSVEAT